MPKYACSHARSLARLLSLPTDPYCINIPDNASGKLPCIMFLSGSGARGDASNVRSLSGYDGFGKLINQYYSGNKGADQKMAAEDFVTIIPISPKNVGGQEIRHWFPENVQKVMSDVKSKHGDKIDFASCHLSGYSMGARGTWRNGVANPDVSAMQASLRCKRACPTTARRASQTLLSPEHSLIFCFHPSATPLSINSALSYRPLPS